MLLAIVLGSILFLNTLLALFVLARNPRSHINISFTFFVVSTVLWMLTNYLSNQVTDYTNALLLNKLIFFFSPYIVFGLLYFSFVFPKSFFKITKETVVLLFLPVFVSNVLTLFDFVMSDITFLESGGTGVVFEWGIYYFTAQFLLYLIASIVILIKKYRQFSGHQKLQLKYLLFGFALFLISATLTNLIIPLTLNIFWISDIGPLFTIATFGFTAYAIGKHRLMDIRLVVARTVAYILLILVLASIYVGLVFGISNVVLVQEINTSQIFLYSLIALFVAFTFQPLRSVIEGITDNIFYRDRYDPHVLLKFFSFVMSSTIELNALTLNVLAKFTTDMKVTKGVFVLLSEKNEAVIDYTQHKGFEIPPHFEIRELHQFLAEKKIIIFEDLEEGNLKQVLREKEIALVVPLFINEKRIGVLCLGHKASGDIYSPTDIGMFEILGPELSVAIRNSQEYEEIKRFNITLKEEVDRATKELQVANSKLLQLDKLKDEFVSLASHELRTPMTAIKSYLWMTLAGKGGAVTEKQKCYLDRAYNSTERLIKLVNEMLNVSRIESGKISLALSSVDILNLVQDTISELLPRSQELGIHLVVQPMENLPPVLADTDKIKEVLINLVGNALKFTPKEGTITLSFAMKDNLVTVSVADNGKGITPEDQTKLFQKFGKVDNNFLTIQNTQGTGLGLYISKSIIALHGGEISVASEGLGKGTIFTFSLKVFHPEDVGKQTGTKTDGVDIIPTNVS